MFDDALLDLLRCPETGQGLRLATAAELADFPGSPPEGGFVTADGDRLYPVRDGLPHLVADEAIPKGEGKAVP